MDERDPVETGRKAMQTIGETMEQARTQVGTTARNASEQLWSATAEAGTRAQDLARQARDQLGPTADMLREQGSRAGEYLTRNVNEYPLTALVVAGLLGYGLAYLIHSRWS